MGVQWHVLGEHGVEILHSGQSELPIVLQADYLQGGLVVVVVAGNGVRAFLAGSRVPTRGRVPAKENLITTFNYYVYLCDNDN
jgi:hypothetical protein